MILHQEYDIDKMKMNHRSIYQQDRGWFDQKSLCEHAQTHTAECRPTALHGH